MEEFLPGDKVALLNDNMEGTVVSILDNERVLLEDENGFEIPVYKSDLVKTGDFTQQKRSTFVRKENEDPVPVVSGKEGLFLCIDKSGSPKNATLLLINNTAHPLYFVAYEKGDKVSGFSMGMADPGTSKTLTTVNIENFENWPEYYIQALFFQREPRNVPPPVNHKFRPSAKAFFGSFSQAPVIDKPAYLFRIDQENFVVREEKIEVKEKKKEPEILTEKPPVVVDLHMEKLVDDPNLYTKGSALEKQMAVFKNMLEKAHSFEYPHITFIHGIGEGILKSRLRGYLAQTQYVSHFQDANEEKYGSGATVVFLKH